tara:strand:- start:1129 stop:1320 length:192 start_codon:yes stop_codon:yes gene_type:complete
MLPVCTLVSLPSFQDFLQSILLALLCAVVIAERSMGGMVHVYSLARYKSMILRVERQTALNVV